MWSTALVNRRAFLQRLGAAAATSVAAWNLDPERLLWVLGRKTIFLPPERSVVAATSDDLAALVRAMGHLWIEGRWHEFNPSKVGMLSDEEYRLAVETGHRLLASDVDARALAVRAATQEGLVRT